MSERRTARRSARALAALLAAGLVAPGLVAADEPSEKKLALIRELLALSGGEAAAEQITETMLAQIEVAYPVLVEEVMRSETDLDAAQLEALRIHLQDFPGFAAVFRQRIAEQIDLDELLEAVYVPLYDAHFSESELAEIVAFYRTPTGRKVVEVLPAVYQEGMERTVPVVQPVMLKVVGEILGERRAELLP